MGLVPMTPETWLELEHTTHRCHAQTCRSSPISSGCMHGVAFFLHLAWIWNLGASRSRPSCGSVVGWVGEPKIFTDLRRTLPFAARGAQGTTLETLWSRTPAEWWRLPSLLLQALCRQSFVHWGSILVLVRGLAPYSIPLLLWALSQ